MDPIDQSEPDSSIEPLNSGDILELQAFIDRKQWIHDKITILESMPPIDVFPGAWESMHAHGTTPGPTRDELATWVAEHDAIEKETEQFDAGDMIKLKRFAKAATKRNLSPQDTDLIEVTLDTLVALDKLLHLLRSRSDLLELVTLRLDWHDVWVDGWGGLSSLVTDITAFVESRARWSPAMNDLSTSLKQRQDLTAGRPELATDDSDISSTTATSRISRFKYFESLSRDAALFSTRLNTLRHTKIQASGKYLDRLIELSHNPIPDFILDEQEKLENRANRDLENIGKFTVSLVGQWKSSDEFHLECLKDVKFGNALANNIQSALNRSPTTEQAMTFSSQSDVISSRTEQRMNPSAPNSLLPAPSHPLFPEQSSYNVALQQQLNSDRLQAVESAKQAQRKSAEYRDAVAIDSQINILREDISFVSELLTGLSMKLEGNGEGYYPCPDLQDPQTLDNAGVADYVDHLPALTADCQLAMGRTAEIRNRLQKISISAGNFSYSASRIRDISPAIARMSEIERSTRAKMANAVSQVDVVSRALELRNTIALKIQTYKELKRKVNQSITTVLNARAKPHDKSSLTTWLESGDASGQDLMGQIDSLEVDLKREIFAYLNSSAEVCLATGIFKFLGTSAEKLRKDVCDLRGEAKLLHKLDLQSKARTDALSRCLELEERYKRLLILTQEDLRKVFIPESNHADTLHERLQEASRLDDDFATTSKHLSEGGAGLFIYDGSYSLSSRASHFESGLLEDSFNSTEELPLLNLAPIDEQVREDLAILLAQIKDAATAAQSMITNLKLAPAARSTDIARDFARVLLTSHLSEIEASLSDSPSANAMRQEDPQLQPSARIIELLEGEAKQNLEQAVQRLEGAFENLVNVGNEASADLSHPMLISRKGDVDAIREMDRTLQNYLAEIRHNLRSRLLPVKETAVSSNSGICDQAAPSSSPSIDPDCDVASEYPILPAIVIGPPNTTSSNNAPLGPEHTCEQRITSAEQIPELTSDFSHTLELGPPLNSSEDAGNTAGSNEAAPGSISAGDANFHSSAIDDVFYPSRVGNTLSAQSALEQVDSLSSRLKSLKLSEWVSPVETSNFRFPSSYHTAQCAHEIDTISREMDDLHAPEDRSYGEGHMRLKEEIDSARSLIARMRALTEFAALVAKCEATQSDLLEAIDSLENPRRRHPSSQMFPELPQEQLPNLMSSIACMMTELMHQAKVLAQDPRVQSEVERLGRTWKELQEMGSEVLQDQKSEKVDSGRYSSSSKSDLTERSLDSPQTTLRPIRPNPDPAVKASKSKPPPFEHRLNPPRKESKSGPRSVSSPITTRTVSRISSSSLYNSTFASRSRTTSMSSSTDGVALLTPVRHRSGQYKRMTSPSPSEASSKPSTHRTPTHSSISKGSFSRAPRMSFGPPNSHVTTSSKKVLYKPNPLSQLDVAVGKIVNNLPIGVSVRAAEGGWEDRCGKYWIGDVDPKLCFCRILRSQTVMVRVGGGWSEISRFIRDHFLSSTLPGDDACLEVTESSTAEFSTPPRRTFSIPAFEISTPSGSAQMIFDPSPRFTATTLTPLRLMRKAEPKPIFATPSQTPRNERTIVTSLSPHTPATWRP